MIVTAIAKVHETDTVSITFVLQKNKSYFDTVTHHTNSSKKQNPVRIWADVFKCVSKIPGASLDTPVNAFHNTITNHTEYITSDQILKSLRWAVDILGVYHFGFTSNKIGYHSIRSGTDMAMYLKKVAVFTIMLQCLWGTATPSSATSGCQQRNNLP